MLVYLVYMSSCETMPLSLKGMSSTKAFAGFSKQRPGWKRLKTSAEMAIILMEQLAPRIWNGILQTWYSHRVEDNQLALLPHDRVAPATAQLSNPVATADEDLSLIHI